MICIFNWESKHHQHVMDLNKSERKSYTCDRRIVRIDIYVYSYCCDIDLHKSAHVPIDPQHIYIYIENAVQKPEQAASSSIMQHIVVKAIHMQICTDRARCTHPSALHAAHTHTHTTLHAPRFEHIMTRRRNIKTTPQKCLS